MTRIRNQTSNNSSAPEIRFLDPGDAPALMRLRHRAIRECAVNFGTPLRVELERRVLYYRRQLMRYQDQDRAALIGCWREGVLVGMTGIRIRRYRGELVGLIFSTFIEAPFRGQGLGTCLVEKGIRNIQQLWRIDHYLMHVEVHNQNALRLYQECGFEITGMQERAFWIEGIAHDVYVLENKRS